MRTLFPPRLLLALLAIATAASAAAETDARPKRPDIELFSIEARHYGARDLDDPTPNTFEEGVTVEPRLLKLKVGLPWRVKTDRSMFTIGLGYDRLELALDNWPDDVPFPDGPYHSLQLPMSYARTFNDPRWGSRFFLTPGVSSDFHGSAGRGVRFQGGALLERKNPGGAFSFGLVLINDYGTPRVFPAVAWMGRVAERQTVVIRLPVLMSWTYAATDELEWGVAARVSGGNYAIGRPEEFDRRQLKYSAGTLAPFVRRSFGAWSVVVETGWVFLHSLEVYDRRHQIRDYDLDQSAFISLGIRRTL